MLKVLTVIACLWVIICQPGIVFGQSISEAGRIDLKENFELCVKKLKGPYSENFCVCKDGSRVAVTGPDGKVIPRPCGEKGQLFCSAFRAPWAEKLGKQGLYLGNLFARDLFLWDSFSDHHNLVRGYILENYFLETHPKHKLAELRAYGGLSGAEFEAAAAPRFFERYVSGPTFDDFKHYLLASELQRRFFVRKDLGQIDKVRILSSRIQSSNPKFKPLRDAIHNQISAQLIPKVEFYRNGLSKGTDKTLYDELITEMRRLTDISEKDIKNQLEEIQDAPLRISLSQQIHQTDTASVESSITQLCSMMARARQVVAARTLNAADSRRLIDLNIISAAVVHNRCNSFLDQNVKMNIQQALELLIALSDAAYGTGLLSSREQDAAKTYLSRLLQSKEIDRVRFYEEFRKADRVVEWALNTVRFVFADTMEKWSSVLPEVQFISDDILRSSPLLIYARVSKKINDHITTTMGINHDFLGEKVGSEVRVLNPGLALGELKINPDQGSYTREQIVALAETPAELEPAAGIITMGEGNMVSHVQLLARSLGIPNIALPPHLFQKLQKASGEKIFFLVSPGGKVSLKRADTVNDKEKAIFSEYMRNKKRKSDGFLETKKSKLPIDRSKLNLKDKTPLDLRHAWRAESGVRYGPKAAFLGELKRLFPDKVSRGIVLPFGIYYEHYQRARVIVPDVLSKQIKIEENESLPRFVERSFNEFFGTLLSSGKTEEELSAWIRPRLQVIQHSLKETPLSPELREALRREFRHQGLFLGHHEEETVGCFVRSDTNVEDLENFNGAGLNLTIFNLKTFREILNCIKEVWASPFSYRSFSWRQTLIDEPLWVLPSIVILESVASEKSGVLISADPRTGDTTKMLLATSEGVGGAVDGSPAETLLWSETGISLLMQFKSPWRRLLKTEGGSVVTASTGNQHVLTPAEIEQLVSATRKISSSIPSARDMWGKERPWDIEFGFQSGKLWLFQVRPFVGNDEINNLVALRELDTIRTTKKNVTLDEVLP
ncbi:PEP/pyruvate-binding domain-containing protein [candidate division CSSED10-310 bacterium]|uniref:Phosphoenolpyruvate synthase n=1 Tax=candidate division CSSED10-310 bacterium TaxID=2855610 RepID=A0ABV6YYQ9_UNCC1